MVDAAGTIVHRVPMPGLVTHVAVDPTGARLYIATDAPADKSDHAVFQQREASSGALIGSSLSVCCADLNGPSAVVPVSNGVWETDPTGMMGMAQLLSADDLTPVDIGGDEGSWTGVNAMSAAYADGIVWILNMGASVTCVDPSTGQIFGRMGNYPDKELAVNDVVSVGGGVYLANSRVIQQLSPDSPCLTGSG
jgi:hypothetical protein